MPIYNKENKYHLLLQSKFWQLIKAGIKQWEFRKLIKGLISGTYYFFAADTKEYLGSAKLATNCSNPNFDKHTADECMGNYEGIPHYWCDAHESLTGNNNPLEYGEGLIIYTFKSINHYSENYGGEVVDIDTYKWIKENYVDKHEFMAYKISDVFSNENKKVGK